MIDYEKPIVLQGLTFEPYRQPSFLTWGKWSYGRTPKGFPKYILTHQMPLHGDLESTQWKAFLGSDLDYFVGFGATAEEAWDNLVKKYSEWVNAYSELVNFAAPLSVEAQT